MQLVIPNSRCDPMGLDYVIFGLREANDTATLLIGNMSKDTYQQGFESH